jgi:serine/threonine protein kinase
MSPWDETKELFKVHEKGHIRKLYEQICQYDHPEQLFGELGSEAAIQEKTLGNAYKYLIKLYHPDLYHKDPQEHQLADNMMKIIHYLRGEAERKIKNGTYGMPADVRRAEPECIIATSTREYRVIRYFIKGEECDIYLAEYDDSEDRFMPVKQAIVKIVTDPLNNYLLENEIQVLKLLAHQSLPKMVDSLIMPEEKKKALILRLIDGYDLYAIREKYPDGIEVRHMCWVLERLLSVLGFLHYNAVLHGNIEPGNIMVRPRDHNAFLIDFLCSLLKPGKDDYLTAVNEAFTAPEVFKQNKPHPAADLYSLGKSMIFLLGGDVEKEHFPDHVDKRVVRFLKEFLFRDPGKRANDAWLLYRRLSDLRLEIFGARHEFLPFEM